MLHSGIKKFFSSRGVNWCDLFSCILSVSFKRTALVPLRRCFLFNMGKLNQLKSTIKLRLLRFHYQIVEQFASFLPERINKIYDCFLFNNELDILKLRLAELYPFVDGFIICESPITFSGEHKPLYYYQNKDLFSRFEDKIQHFVIPEPPASVYVDNPINPNSKTSEFWQRNQMARAIQSAQINDLILISDVDEIPNPAVFSKVAKICRFAKCVVFFSQDWFLLFLNCRVKQKDNVVFASNGRTQNYCNSKWLGTFACMAKVLNDRYTWDLNSVWGLKWGNHQIIEPIVDHAGWHFSYMGGMAGLLSKSTANGMVPYLSKDVQDLQVGRFLECALRIESFGSSYPKILQQNPQPWSHMMTQQNSFPELVSQLQDYLSEQEAKDT